MSYKVAVASTDGNVINEHYGRCRKFLIFNVEEESGKTEVLELRDCDALCHSGEHSDNIMERNAELLKDCRAVLVSQIGPSAEQYLRTRGIDVFPIGDFIEDALAQLNQYYNKIAARKSKQQNRE